jgi:hypothetical protein
MQWSTVFLGPQQWLTCLPNARKELGERSLRSDVRAALVFFVFALPTWVGAGSKRVRGNVRTIVGDLGMLAAVLRSGAVRRCELYHRCLLVHGVNLFRKPSSHNRPLVDEYCSWEAALPGDAEHVLREFLDGMSSFMINQVEPSHSP